MVSGPKPYLVGGHFRFNVGFGLSVVGLIVHVEVECHAHTKVKSLNIKKKGEEFQIICGIRVECRGGILLRR